MPSSTCRFLKSAVSQPSTATRHIPHELGALTMRDIRIDLTNVGGSQLELGLIHSNVRPVGYALAVTTWMGCPLAKAMMLSNAVPK